MDNIKNIETLQIDDKTYGFSDRKIKNIVNIIDLGAIGDGIVDNTEIIQNAINNNNVIYIPTGEFNVTQLNIPSNKIFIGEGLGNSIINFTSTGNGINILSESNAIKKIEFNNLSFRTKNSQNIIYIHNAFGIVFNNCEIYDTSNNLQSTGILIDGTNTSNTVDMQAYYITLNGGRITSCNIGVSLINTANSNLILGVEIYKCNKSIHIDNANGNKIAGCTLQDFMHCAIELNNTNEVAYNTNNIIVGNYIEAYKDSENLVAGINIVNNLVRTTQLIANKYNNIRDKGKDEVVDNGAETLRLEHSGASFGQEPITLPAFVRVNPKTTNFANAYKNKKLFGCIQMFADDNESGKIKALNRIYNEETGEYGYFWSEVLGFNNNNRYDLTDKTIENGTLLNNNILLYYGKYIKLGTGNLPNMEGALMYDSTFKRPKFSDGANTKYLQTVAMDSTENRSKYQGYGFMMFDTTLQKPIWYNGTNWVDATGTVV